MRTLLVWVVTVVSACRVPMAPAPPTDSGIIVKSHALLDSVDRGDVAAVAAQLGTNYIHFEGKYADATKDLTSIKARPAHPDPSEVIASRAWSEERVFARGNDAVFIGKAREKQGGNAIHGGYEDDGWYTLMWSREGAAWKLVYRGWQRAGGASDAQVWNHIFENKLGFEHKPNKLLVEYASKHVPGTAIDVAMGQGAQRALSSEHGMGCHRRRYLR